MVRDTTFYRIVTLAIFEINLLCCGVYMCPQ